MKKVKAMMFHELELNTKMRKGQKEEEVMLFQHIRKHYANRILHSPEDFTKILANIHQRIDAINEQRTGVGPYLCLDAFPPTDITFGWIRIHHATDKAQARISICRTEGDIILSE